MREMFEDYLFSLFTILIVIHGWQRLEIMFDGGIKPSIADTIVGFVLLISLNLNYRLIKYK